MPDDSGGVRGDDGSRSVFDVELFVDVCEVRFHGCFAEMEALGDRPIAQALREKFEHVEFADAEVVVARFFVAIDDPIGDDRGEHGPAGGDLSDCCEDVVGEGVFEDVAACSSVECCGDVGVGRERGEDDDLWWVVERCDRGGAAAPPIPVMGDPSGRHRPGVGGVVHGAFGGVDIGYDSEIWLVDCVAESDSEQWVVVDDEY
ncbi:MAG: hypothetical protein R2710_03975 [Acidimicrobiales bacterium]